MDLSSLPTSTSVCSSQTLDEQLRVRPRNSSFFTRRPGFRRKDLAGFAARQRSTQSSVGTNGAQEKKDDVIVHPTQTKSYPAISLSPAFHTSSNQQPKDILKNSTADTHIETSGTDGRKTAEFKDTKKSTDWRESDNIGDRSLSGSTRDVVSSAPEKRKTEPKKDSKNVKKGTTVQRASTVSKGYGYNNTESAKDVCSLSFNSQTLDGFNWHETRLHEYVDSSKDRSAAGTKLVGRASSFSKDFTPAEGAKDGSSSNHKSQMSDRASWSYSLPFKLKSESGCPAVTKSHQSIQERIEKLYGSASEVSDGGTFPRRFSKTDAKATVKRGGSFVGGQSDTSSIDSETSLLSGTKSLDRARSRHNIANQVRSDRAAEGSDSFARPSKKEERDNPQSERPAFSQRLKDTNEKGKHQNLLKVSANDKDTLGSEEQKKKEDKKKLPAGMTIPSSASVRNKIKQFEALAQRTVGQVSAPRRTFSMPSKTNAEPDGLKKSKSATDIVGKRGTEQKVAAASRRTSETGENRISWSTWSGRAEGRGSELLGENKNSYFHDFGGCHSLKNEQSGKVRGSSGQSGRGETHDFQESNARDLVPRNAASAQPKGFCESNMSVARDKSKANFTDSMSAHPSKQTQNASLATYDKNKSLSVFVHTHKVDDPAPLPSSLPPHDPAQGRKDKERERRQFHDLTDWIAGLKPGYKCWSDDENVFTDDDVSTQRDQDSNYDSDSGDSSVTITSNMSQSDRQSFSVSLSELCNFADTDNESEDDDDDWESVSRRSASISSDASVFSYVSMLETEELDRLLEDVKTVEDDNLKDYEDVQVVVLHKDLGVGLGFSLAGGVDQDKPITVHKVFRSGVAAQEGNIREGDMVLSINGTAFRQSTHREALDVLKSAKTRRMGVVVLRKDDSGVPVKKAILEKSEEAEQTQHETGYQMCVRLQKNSRHLGFSLQGGVDSSEGNKPLIVKKIFQDGPVGKVFPGDEILEIDGMSMVAMSSIPAWNFIKKLPPGPVEVVLRRTVKHQQT